MNICSWTGLLAGGMGVTPMINLSHVILKNPNDKVKVGRPSQPDTYPSSVTSLVGRLHKIQGLPPRLLW